MTKDLDDVKAVETLYYDSLMSGDYITAYKLLDDSSQKYYGSADNFISTFTVPGLKITEYKIYKVDVSAKDGKAKVKIVISFKTPSFITLKDVEDSKTDTDLLVKKNGKWKIMSKLSPYKSVKVLRNTESCGLRMETYFVDLYDGGVSIHVAFANTGKDDILIFPYNTNTTITDDKKISYPTVELPRVVDINLYSGLTLKPGSKILGFINFAKVNDEKKNITLAPDRKNKKLTLKVGGNLNPKQKTPFDLIIKDMQINK
jgi:hypothetical protein